MIAEVSLTGTFSYNGTTATAISASASHTTYQSWSYKNESVTTSGNKARVTAILTKLFSSNIPVDITLTCSPTGKLS